MTKKVMKLIGPESGLMQFKVCGSPHYANIKPGSNGLYYRGAWQCINGCKLPEGSNPVYNGYKADNRRPLHKMVKEKKKNESKVTP